MVPRKLPGVHLILKTNLELPGKLQKQRLSTKTPQALAISRRTVKVIGMGVLQLAHLMQLSESFYHCNDMHL